MPLTNAVEVYDSVGCSDGVGNTFRNEVFYDSEEPITEALTGALRLESR